jgi:hypothetical protein
VTESFSFHSFLESVAAGVDSVDHHLKRKGNEAPTTIRSDMDEPLDLIRLSIDERIYVKCRGDRGTFKSIGDFSTGISCSCLPAPNTCWLCVPYRYSYLANVTELKGKLHVSSKSILRFYPDFTGLVDRPMTSTST